jgi:ADP-ribose pyrophosphatase YjhB (NUDIX family)
MVKDAHFITLAFVTKEFDGEPKVMEPDEITEWRWFDLHELPSPMFFPSARVIQNYLDGVVYRGKK